VWFSWCQSCENFIEDCQVSDRSSPCFLWALFVSSLFLQTISLTSIYNQMFCDAWGTTPPKKYATMAHQDVLFEHDNAPAHTALSVQPFFAHNSWLSTHPP
jgi:hypothetical protein